MVATVTELGPNMTLEDMRKEAKVRLEQASEIELKHGDGSQPLTGDDLARWKQIMAEVDVLHARVGDAEEVRALSQKTQQMLDHYSKPQLPAQLTQGGTKTRQLSPGEQFIRGAAYLEVKNRGLMSNSLNHLDFAVPMADGTSLLEWKATLSGSVSTSGGALVPTDVRSTVVDMLFPQINVLDLIPRTPTESDSIEYIRQTVQQLAVAFVAEATGSARTGTDGLKPESTLGWQNVTAYVRTAAHWIPITNRMLSDSRAMPGIVNTQMLMGLTQAVEAQVISGDGSGENLLGILNTPNIQTFARGAFNEVDAIFHARTLVRTGSKLAPTGVVMHPVDYEQVRLLRENAASATLGQYLMAPPTTAGVPTVFGMPLVESENIAPNTVLVGNFSQGAQVFDREQSAIRVGLINEQFIRNQQTLLAEQRLALVVWRPPAFCSITAF